MRRKMGQIQSYEFAYQTLKKRRRKLFKKEKGNSHREKRRKLCIKEGGNSEKKGNPDYF